MTNGAHDSRGPVALRGLMAGVLAGVLSAAIVVGFAPSTPLVVAVGGSSAFAPVGPIRLADTRDADCGCRRLDANTIRVTIGGRVGVPTAITAAAVTITAVGGGLAGFVSVYPSGAARPATSVVNVAPQAVAANSTIAAIGGDGAIDVFVSVDMAIVVDVTGVFAAANSASAGRFVALGPARLLDTREQGPSLASGATVTVARPSAVPADATALAVNVTGLDQSLPGFVSGGPAGAPIALTSFLNVDGTGRPRAAAVILPVSAAGLTLVTSAGGHLVIDVVGWFTGASSPNSGDGLFVPVDPTRLVDTRTDNSRIWRTGEREVPITITGAAALVTNVTLDRTDGAGFVTAHAAGTEIPATSTLNAPGRDSTIANAAITAVSDRGVAYYSNAGTDLVVDLTGIFTGSPVAATLPARPNVMPIDRVLMVGDSTLGALDVVTRTREAFVGFHWSLDTANCRRVADQGCTSDYTKVAPSTVVDAIATAPGAFDVVVVKAGYNNPLNPFVPGVDAVIAAARAKGARTVIWFTFSDSDTAYIGLLEQQNATLQALAGSPAYPELVAADWHDYSLGQTSWFVADRRHLTVPGAWATADYIARHVAHLGRRPCPKPWAPGGALELVCPDPDDAAVAAGGPPDLRRLYGF